MGAEDEFLVGLAQFGIAQQKESGVLLRKGAGLAHQAHIDFFQQAVALFAIADFAGGHQILPRALSTTRTRDNMIKRQVAAALTAILAGFIVAQQDVCPRRLEGYTRYPYIG